ncbi:hypothetical protein N0V94_003510 [Neodidymelliopsis sp. IMI 364377]|nr:hypothetical protein N0V94_003510 [Neodidymelliopsis sp. IMI 364377]
MASGSVFSGTLHTITSTKLEELLKQRTAFTQRHVALLSAAKAEQDPLQRLKVVADGTKLCLNVKTAASEDEGRSGRVISGGTHNSQLETDLRNLDRFLEQARFDPSVSTKVLEDWENKLLQYLSIQATKFQYADLYGKLVAEWLSPEKSAPAGGGGDNKMSESFDELPSAKRLAARTEWEESVFEPATVDVPALKVYLERLFIAEKKSVASSLKNLRSKIKIFQGNLKNPEQFNTSSLRWVLKSLQSSDLLSNEKREVLGDFLSNDVILIEIADVLNMRMEALDHWAWGDQVLLEQRRKINGQFHIHMDEDILQAIFLHYIGVKWSVFFKSAFVELRADSKTWQSNRSDIPKADRMRRGYFLGENGNKIRGNLDDKRSKIQRKRYYINKLLDYEEQQNHFNEGEEEAEFADFVNESMKRKKKARGPEMAHFAAMSVPNPHQSTWQATAEEFEEEDDDMGFALYDEEILDTAAPESDDEIDQPTKSTMESKQSLLHLLAAEIILNTRLNNELTCFHTVFESWNMLLSHDTALTILDFFGVSKKWMGFFQAFLKAPLKFIDDDHSTKPRLRQRGAPDSHALSEVFGETVLFCLDFSVNQSTGGGFLHRLGDDVWFWNKDYEKCASAWTSLLEFAQVTGVKINNTKSGSIRVGREGELEIDNRLPHGEIRWGFLFLNPSSGRFDIDRKMVDSHVSELCQQLQAKSMSVIDWIQVWNSYAATFFSSNFGKPANCFGREHIDTMLATHRHIQESVFEGSDVVQHLKQMIKDRFDVSDIPDGFLYFPVELGGLELKSPFVDLLQIRNSVKSNPYGFLDEYEEAEKDDYIEAKRKFDRGDLENRRKNVEKPSFQPEPSDVFFTMDEFVRYREQFAGFCKANLKSVYVELLNRPQEESIEASSQIRQAIENLAVQSNLRGITSSWWQMNAYWRWIAQFHGPGMIERFGSLNVVDPGWLPIGMVGLFRQRRTKWQGTQQHYAIFPRSTVDFNDLPSVVSLPPTIEPNVDYGDLQKIVVWTGEREMRFRDLHVDVKAALLRWSTEHPLTDWYTTALHRVASCVGNYRSDRCIVLVDDEKVACNRCVGGKRFCVRRRTMVDRVLCLFPLCPIDRQGASISDVDYWVTSAKRVSKTEYAPGRKLFS